LGLGSGSKARLSSAKFSYPRRPLFIVLFFLIKYNRFLLAGGKKKEEKEKKTDGHTGYELRYTGALDDFHKRWEDPNIYLLERLPSPSILAIRTYVKMSAPATRSLCLRSQPCPASRAACPPSTTTPKAALPLGLLPKAAACGEHDGAPGSGMRSPVRVSILFSSIHFQFSLSSSGHSALNFAPPSPALMLPFWLTPAARVCDPPPVEFHHLVRPANHFLSASVAPTLPVVISSLVIKERRPIRIVETSQAGLKDLGWKSLMLRQRRVDGWKRPDGVCIRIAGGANG